MLVYQTSNLNHCLDFRVLPYMTRIRGVALVIITLLHPALKWWWYTLEAYQHFLLHIRSRGLHSIGRDTATTLWVCDQDTLFLYTYGDGIEVPFSLVAVKNLVALSLSLSSQQISCVCWNAREKEILLARTDRGGWESRTCALIPQYHRILKHLQQGVPLLLSFLKPPFSRTYVDAAGCPFTWWSGIVPDLIFGKKNLNFFFVSGSGPDTSTAWFSGSAWFVASWSSCSLQVFNFSVWKTLHMVNHVTRFSGQKGE